MKVMAKAQLKRREPQDVEGRKPPLKHREGKKETKSSLNKRPLKRLRKLRGEAARKVNVHIGCIFAAHSVSIYAAVFMIFLYWEP
jgi:hypothetical protein